MSNDAGGLLEFLASHDWHFVDHAESVDDDLAFDALNGVDDQGDIPRVQSLKGLKLVFKYSNFKDNDDLFTLFLDFQNTNGIRGHWWVNQWQISGFLKSILNIQD